MCVLLLTLASNLVFLVPLNMLLQASFIRCLLAVMYILLSHTYRSLTGWIPGLFISLNHGKISTHGPVLVIVLAESRTVREWGLGHIGDKDRIPRLTRLNSPD
jgi:hypothetical protein